MIPQELKPLVRGLVVSSFLSSVVLVGLQFGYSAVFLFLSGAALLGAIWCIYLSLAEGSDDNDLSIEEALSLISPSAEEEEKRAVLRALHDLEFEYSLGKISETDYREGAEEYRKAASRLIAQSDQTLA